MKESLATRAAEAALRGHRHYPYRGCAIDPERPGLAAGADIPLDSWDSPDIEGGSEDQIARQERQEAAIKVCHACPVLALCDTYANTETTPTEKGEQPQLAVPRGIYGGVRSLDRHKARARRLQDAAPALDLQALPAQVRTEQRQAYIRALAAHTDPADIAAAAGMTLRTAAWQRSRLTTLLGLSHATATRNDLLTVAQQAGLLDDDIPVTPGETTPVDVPLTPRPAAPAPTARPAPSAPAPARRPRPPVTTAPPTRLRIPSPRRDRFTLVPGQLLLAAALPATQVLEPAA